MAVRVRYFREPGLRRQIGRRYRMSVIYKRGLNGKPQQYTQPGGGSSGGAAGALSTNFVLQNWGSAASAPFMRIGMAFKQGDVPAGSVPAIAGVAAQFDALTFWPDGSLRFAVAHVRDASSFAAGESRTYAVTSAAGSVNNTSTLTLAGILAGHNFAVNFTGVAQSSDGSTFAQRGSGAFTASLAAHAAVSTRVTKTHSGPVCEGWMVWGMATDNSGGAADAHLKTYWHIDAWKNADGSIYALEVAAVVSQDWWSIANKYCLGYSAALVDGASTIGSYANVVHPYGSQWITCKTIADNNIGRRPWIGGAIPTLLYQPNQTYWISSGLVPPFDLSLAGQVNSLNSALTPYVPCQNADQRASIDNEGGYNGRGTMTVPETIAFVRQSAFDMACMRVNGHAGLGVPYHQRSNRTRTRPQDGGVSDVASSVIPQPMLPEAASYYDFTAQGLPASVYAYTGPDGLGGHSDGFVAPSGGMGVWATQTGDASHAVAYSYGAYLFEGERYHLEATLDHALYALQQQPSAYGCRGLLLAGDSTYASLNIPSTSYDSIPQLWKPTNVRAVGWSLYLLARSSGMISADHEAYQMFQHWRQHVGNWVAASMQYQPPDMLAAGAFFPRAGYDGVPDTGMRSPWMEHFIAQGAYMVFLMTGDTRFRALGNMVANVPIGIMAAGDFYRLDMYRALQGPLGDAWNPTTNPYYPPAQMPNIGNSGTVTAAVAGSTDGAAGQYGSLAFTGQDWNAIINPMPVTDGDWIVFGPAQASGYGNGVTPQGATAGVQYFLKNVTGGPMNTSSPPPTSQVATTKGGAPITLTTASGADFAWFPQAAHQSQVGAVVAGQPLYTPQADSYVSTAAATFMLARQAGNPAATDALAAELKAFMAPMNRAAYMPWALAA